MLTMMTKVLFLLLLSLLLNASTPPYTLTIAVDKKEIFLGDTLRLSLIFQYADLEDYEIDKIQIPNFEVKELGSKDYKTEDAKFVEEIEYKLIPQQSGSFTIGKFQVNIETIAKNYKHLNNKSKYTKKIFIQSNSIGLQVKKLPDNLSAIGSYELTTTVDKTNVKAAEVVTLTIKLEGTGNIKNLDFIKLKIPNATTYLIMSSKSEKKHILTKTYEIICEHSYKIPSLSLEYFNQELGIKRVTQSHPFDINILQAKEKIKNTATLNTDEKLLFFFIGVLSMIFFLILYIFYKKITLRKKESSFINSLKNTKNSSTLYKQMVIYLGRDKELDRFIFLLETSQSSLFKEYKKSVIKRVQEINLNIY